MIEKLPLKGKHIILRAPKETDIEDYLQCGKNPEIIRMYGGDTRYITPLTREKAIKWYQDAENHPYIWFIEHNNKCIGLVRLTVNEQDKRARYGIGIHDINKLGKGFGTEATNLILEYAFNVLKLHKVDLRVLEYNKRAIRCYEKCGFIVEGIDREGALIEDKFESDLFMSILDYEYKNRT